MSLATRRARAHFWGQVAEVKGKWKLGPGASAAAAAVAACAAAFDSLQTASNSTRSTRARSKLNEQDTTRQDLLECRRRGKAGGRGRGRGTCCCCCLCTLTGPVQPYEFVGQLPQTDNHYNQVNKMMIIVSSSASTAAAAQHVALFIFSDLFEDFLWVVRSTLFPPRVSAFSTRCTYAYVCFLLFIYMGITSLEQSTAEQTHYHKKKRKIILIYL